MKDIKRVLSDKLSKRPFDFYVAAILFFMGFFAIFSDSWPENFGNPAMQTIIVIISLYYVFAGAMIMISLGCQRKKFPILSLMGEMYGWLFVACGALATSFAYIGMLFSYIPNDWRLWAIMLGVWIGLFIASAVRFVDLFNVYRSLKK